MERGARVSPVHSGAGRPMSSACRPFRIGDRARPPKGDDMAVESVSASTTIVADPAKHAAIDGTGWVREPLDSQPLTGAGQVFRMAMYHENHPDGRYLIANRVQVFYRPTAVSWEPGHVSDDGSLRFGGWTWRYDLAPAGPSRTTVTSPTTGRRSRSRCASASGSPRSVQTVSTTRWATYANWPPRAPSAGTRPLGSFAGSHMARCRRDRDAPAAETGGMTPRTRARSHSCRARPLRMAGCRSSSKWVPCAPVGGVSCGPRPTWRSS